MTNENLTPDEPANDGEAPQVDATADAADITADAAKDASADVPATDDVTGEDGVVDLSELDQALLRVAELEEEVARRKADLYNLGQEYNGYVKRSKAEARTQYDAGITKVLENLLSVLDDAHLAREHGDLTGPAGTVVEKLEQTLATNFGLVRFGEIGDEFDPEHHEALMNQTSSDVETQQVQHIIQPGYKQGEKVVRPARVGVVSPE
ncbi:nucleotide exchange factor GrpE [Trueperella pecoris]|uniref:Protein GrpE n=1 Tax=Trueperella pecoris TaxID=2733571 RepID=A0A7M1QWH6_9ACTO|nr:nucleotide exchange factor GrpE [Trueperella pecoris]QOR45864.1 nucleotide exchange factor GrpE [Trueperella pecoris]QTG75692.1 nucleotide exchange factor GrpE [Trueperella pecoris]